MLRITIAVWGSAARNALRRFDSAQIGHGDIDDRDIRLRRFGLLNRLPAIRRLGDHAEFRLAFQQQPQAPAHYGVIVSQQDANRFHGCRCSGGPW